ncbi:MAG: DUF4249 domain-containing protein [Cytophagaceae bacterium]|nr:MAG: DUF4249 domain-containing protein [Cytophagaceae bacterium]
MRQPLFDFVVRWGARGALLGLAGCVDAYLPDIINAPNRYLVVDGFINGNGVTRIKLSRTENVAATAAPPVEKGAKLFIVDNTGQRYALTEKTSGNYQSDSLLLAASRQYQLRITTADNATYQSDATVLKVTPPIDKLGFRVASNQVQLVLSTHDASAQSRYYSWSLVETWQFNAGLESTLEYYPKLNGPNHSLMDTRTTPIYTCWRTEQPTTIAQTTTSQLSQDAITDYVVRSFSDRAERVKVRYSVLVSQYTETPEEFAYRELLRKNTEAVGTVNDPLPVQLTGNVHRLDNAAEPVLGFVGAHTVQAQRLFINKADLPAHAPTYYDTPYTTCGESYLYFCDDQGTCDVAGVIKLFASPDYVPLDYTTVPRAGISSASADCADCRRRGTTTKPSFW